MSNSFALTVDELNLVLKALGSLAFNESANLITRLVNDFNAQQAQTTDMAAAIQQAALDPANIVPADKMPPPNRKARRASKHNGARA